MNEAQSTQLANIRDRVEEVLQQEDHKEIQYTNVTKAVLKEIDQTKQKSMQHHEMVVVDEYETKLKKES